MQQTAALYFTEKELKLIVYKLSCGNQSDNITEIKDYCQRAVSNMFGGEE